MPTEKLTGSSSGSVILQKIDNFSDLSPQITRQMRRGVCTNAFYTPAEYSRAIAEGTLYGEELDGGLLLLWARDG